MRGVLVWALLASIVPVLQIFGVIRRAVLYHGESFYGEDAYRQPTVYCCDSPSELLNVTTVPVQYAMYSTWLLEPDHYHSNFNDFDQWFNVALVFFGTQSVVVVGLFRPSKAGTTW